MADVSEITIIHLEDNSLDAELAAEMLFSSGLPCKVRRIYRLEEFRQCLQEYMETPTFDLVLADYNMPGFDGLTALRMTRQIDSDVPFILLSGALGEEVAVEILRSGATDYVLKNNMQRLSPVVKRAIQEYRIRQSERKSQLETRRARDEAQKANAAKSRFLGRISHELRTPLNAIIGYTQLMQADPMSEEQQHCSEQILKAGEHLLQLINEVLDITRIESGVIPMKIQPTLLAPVIDRSVDLVRPLARDAKVSISIDGGPCELNILADKDRLAQVLINLITNAVKYTRPNGYVFVECQQERPGFVKLLVRDTGLGIAPSKMERLFTPFDRLDLETNSSIPGTGLGLTVTKALVENMGGIIGVVSSENEGSIFWVEVPTSLQYPEEEDLPESISASRLPDL
jgi:signal transduction histidine kinase